MGIRHPRTCLPDSEGSQKTRNEVSQHMHNPSSRRDERLTRGATFSGELEIPLIKTPAWLPNNPVFTPFDQRERRVAADTVVCFNIEDEKFADLIEQPEEYVEDLSRFGAVTSPDCSLRRNAPLARQVENLYLNRRTGSYLQRHGVNVIPQVRWGSSSTFTTEYFPERIAFLGVEPRSPIAVGTYGCFKSIEDRRIFLAGFDAMMEALDPSIVFVYGAMPDRYFAHDLFATRDRLVHCTDWIALQHGREDGR